ncbi:MAG: alpha/beta fold hydrolase [Desulfobacteraceae bacterium]
MNRFAFYLSGYALRTFAPFSRARVRIHGQENIPEGSVLFTANHFTRIETVFLPYYIHSLIKKPIWSIAAAELFKNELLKKVLSSLGAVSTRDPDRYYLITKSLIKGEAAWIVFPEGMMVKNKKLINHDHFEISRNNEIIRPHTGAATIALRCEFYRERMRRTMAGNPSEFKRLVDHFDITDPEAVLNQTTWIVPVNITYYPIQPRENIISKIALNIMEMPSQQVIDELMTEGAMLFSGVDVDIRFGRPIDILEYFFHPVIESDLTSGRKIDFDRNLCSRPVMKTLSADIMKRYLTSVYSMVTINYDHILACLLKHMPPGFQGEDRYLLKCRLFLVLAELAGETGIHLHHSLTENQIHILSDDRFKRVEDFLQTAVDTGIISISDNRIFKNTGKFTSSHDFHTVRMENPVSVMANEVEPLKGLESLIRNTALKPSEKILDDVQKFLVEKAGTEFALDYKNNYIQGESSPKAIGKPLLFKAEKPKAGILLVHGYMAAPAEMKKLAQYLHARSYTVYVPRLKGHGTSPADLMNTRYNDWIESVEQGHIILRHLCGTVLAGGFSTGAGLALDLCTRVSDITAVFAAAPPFRLKDLGANFVPAVNLFNTMMKKARLSGVTKEFVDNNPENPDINYKKNPVAGILQLEKLMAELDGKLAEIDIPALVLQSRKDPVVNPDGTYKLFKKLGSEQKEYFLFDFDRHGILLGKGAQRVYTGIENFLSQWTEE